MKIEITSNSKAVQSFFDGVVKRQMPFAMQRTINDLAFAVREQTYNEMKAEFDRPRPDFTLRSIVVDKATDKRNPEAWVGLRKDGGFRRSLAHQFNGGTRAWKKVEGAFEKLGVLPAGMNMVPSKAMALDAFGNVPVGMIRKLLKQPWQQIMAKRNLKGKAGNGGGYFVVHPSDRTKLHPGIWHRSADYGLNPIMIFGRRARYQRQINMEAIGNWTMDRIGKRMLEDNLAKAIASDRQLNRTLSR
jgi:hypothetical protein